MQSSISSRSLITGNVSTEESRNEIKKRPGAPRAPANAMIFCFQVLSWNDKNEPPRKVEISLTEARKVSEERFDGFGDYVVYAVELLRLDHVGREDIDDVAERA